VLTRLLLLWLLSEGPLHGYRIKRSLDDERFAFWFPLEFGSIYAVLRTLEKQGHVKLRGKEREGRRPRRTVYAITPRGRAHYRELLRRAWRELPSPAEPVCVALAASGDLTEDETAALRRERAAALRERLAHLETLAAAAPSADAADRLRRLTEAELAWTRRTS
jgi:DNA-binding PadR family transcriptional regulator